MRILAVVLGLLVLGALVLSLSRETAVSDAGPTPVETAPEVQSVTPSAPPVPGDAADPIEPLRSIAREPQGDLFRVPDDPIARAAELMAAADAGSADAAYALFALMRRCGFNRLLTDEEAAREADEIFRVTGSLMDRDALRAERERIDELCEQGLPDGLHWIGRAAELGHYEAMLGYWHAHRVAAAKDPGRFDDSEIAAARERARRYQIAARDQGYAEAFTSIGYAQAGLIHGPFERDEISALAHLYASARLHESQEASDAPRIAALRRQARQLEMRVPAYALDDARARAESLLDRCCR